jgi:hypothetical protein
MVYLLDENESGSDRTAFFERIFPGTPEDRKNSFYGREQELSSPMDTAINFVKSETAGERFTPHSGCF